MNMFDKFLSVTEKRLIQKNKFTKWLWKWHRTNKELENLSAKLKVLENHFVTLTSELEDKVCRLRIMEAKLINFKETKLHEEFLKCKKCDFRPDNTSNLQKHMSEYHSSSNYENRHDRFKCRHCEETFERKYNLKHHLSEVHARSFNCRECGQVFNILYTVYKTCWDLKVWFG